MDALPGLKRNLWSKSLTVTMERCYVLFRTESESNTPKNTSCMVTYFSSHKPSKLHKQDMRGTVEEVRTIS